MAFDRTRVAAFENADRDCIEAGRNERLLPPPDAEPLGGAALRKRWTLNANAGTFLNII
jgi:hypothetical protein